MNNDNVQLILDGINFLKVQNEEICKRIDNVEAELKEVKLRLAKVESVLSGVRSEVIDHRFNLTKLVTNEEFTEFRSLNLKFHDDTKGALVRLEEEMTILIANNKDTQKRIEVLEKAA